MKTADFGIPCTKCCPVAVIAQSSENGELPVGSLNDYTREK
jgi:hypothetical protein